MTTVYFIRHAQPDYSNHNDIQRPLTKKGLEDRLLVTKYLSDKKIDAVLSSPFVRAIDTITHFADTYGLEVILVSDFRERKIDSSWIEDFETFAKMQWEDFNYKLTDGESLKEVQDRNIHALEEVLIKYENQTIVVGSHGTVMGTILNYYDKIFGYEDFGKMRNKMPWIVKFIFHKKDCISIEKIDLLES